MLQLLPVGVALGAPYSQVASRPFGVFGGIRLVDWAHLLIRFVFVISDIHQPCTVLLRGRRTRPPSQPCKVQGWLLPPALHHVQCARSESPIAALGKMVVGL